MQKLLTSYLLNPTFANALKLQFHSVEHPEEIRLLDRADSNLLDAALWQTRPDSEKVA
jgi:hypothetical protein